jgi:hypothetical protein
MASNTPQIKQVEATDTKSKKEEKPEHIEYFDEKRGDTSSAADSESPLDDKRKKRIKSPRDLVTEVLSLEDDPTQNPWTFRMWFIGIGISVFGG